MADGAAVEVKRPVSCGRVLGDIVRSPARLRNWVRHLFATFGRDVVLAMVAVYVLQGVRFAFLYIGMDYFYMDAASGLGLSAGDATYWKTLTKLPWSFKPAYGILADLVAIRGSHRKSARGWPDSRWT